MKHLSKLPVLLAVVTLAVGALQFSAPAQADEGTCEDRCAHMARQAYARCVDAGHDQRRCAHWARDLYRRCVRENC